MNTEVNPTECDHLYFPETDASGQAIGQRCRLCGWFNSLHRLELGSGMSLETALSVIDRSVQRLLDGGYTLTARELDKVRAPVAVYFAQAAAPTSYGDQLAALEARKCPTCGGLGRCNDVEPGDIAYREWACPSCKGTGLQASLPPANLPDDLLDRAVCTWFTTAALPPDEFRGSPVAWRIRMRAALAAVYPDLGEIIRIVTDARRVWLEENPAEDGRDQVTPFDQFLYGVRHA